MGKRDGTYFKTSTAAPLQLIWIANWGKSRKLTRSRIEPRTSYCFLKAKRNKENNFVLVKVLITAVTSLFLIQCIRALSSVGTIFWVSTAARQNVRGHIRPRVYYEHHLWSIPCSSFLGRRRSLITDAAHDRR